MLLCAIPRPSKHANPFLNTHATHYTISLARNPRLAHASTHFQRFKDIHTNTKMCYLLSAVRNSLYWFNYNFVHYHLPSPHKTSVDAEGSHDDCWMSECFWGCASKNAVNFHILWDLSGNGHSSCVKQVMSKWSKLISKNFTTETLNIPIIPSSEQTLLIFLKLFELWNEAEVSLCFSFFLNKII